MNAQRNYKPLNEIKGEIEKFLKKHKNSLYYISSEPKISQYFECQCYHLIIRYYELSGYSIKLENLQKGVFIFKINPAGHSTNFSYISAKKTFYGKNIDVAIRQNTYVQSYYNDKIFLNQDIVVHKNDISIDNNNELGHGYNSTYVSKQNLLTYIEVKHQVPFPELIINFIGVVNELTPDLLENYGQNNRLCHIAPTLMISGPTNNHNKLIKASLEERYSVNILSDIFSKSNLIFSRSKKSELKKI